MFTGDELPVIKSFTVIQQQFYVIHNQHTAVLVDGLRKLIVDLLKTLNQKLFFPAGNVQRLPHIIGEKMIVFDMLSERCTMNKVRVKS